MSLFVCTLSLFIGGVNLGIIRQRNHGNRIRISKLYVLVTNHLKIRVMCKINLFYFVFLFISDRLRITSIMFFLPCPLRDKDRTSSLAKQSFFCIPFMFCHISNVHYKHNISLLCLHFSCPV